MTAALVDVLDPPALLAAFCAGRTDVGAVVSFTGIVRAEAETEALELETYPALAEAEIARVAAEVRARHGLLDLLVRDALRRGSARAGGGGGGRTKLASA